MKNIFSVILGLLILITSMGFTVSSHICGGKKVKSVISFVDADVSCGMEKDENQCTGKEQMKANCCEDEFNKILMDEDYTQEGMKVEFSPNFFIALVISNASLFEVCDIQKDCFRNHSPPPLVRNIPVLIQSFLI